MKINFLTPAEARTLFATPDSYATKLPPSNLAMVNPSNPTLQGYQDVFLNSFGEFSADDKERMNEVAKEFLDKLNVTINLVKTLGTHALDITQTRGETILATHGFMGSATFVHEVYHILSRRFKLTDDLASIWGFEKGETQEIDYPGYLLNPDAEDTNYKIEVIEKSTNKKIKVYPFIAEGLRTGLKVEGENRYLQEDDTNYASLIKNTSYTAHPEEICAEHFAILTTGRCIFMSELDYPTLSKYQTELLKLMKKHKLLAE